MEALLFIFLVCVGFFLLFYNLLYLNVEGYGDDSICAAQPKCLDEEKVTTMRFSQLVASSTAR